MNSIRMKLVNMAFLILTFIFSVILATMFQKENLLKTLEPKIQVDTVYVSKNGSKGVFAFMRHMSMVESDNNHRVVNRFGMMGKYQFSPRTLQGLGFNVSKEQFLADPELQDEAMIKLIQNNKRELRSIIRQFSGKVVNGVYVTESGIIAGAHLVGTGGVLAFFYPEKYGHNTADGNGTPVSLYMKKFAGYNLKNI